MWVRETVVKKKAEVHGVQWVWPWAHMVQRKVDVRREIKMWHWADLELFDGKMCVVKLSV